MNVSVSLIEINCSKLSVFGLFYSRLGHKFKHIRLTLIEKKILYFFNIDQPIDYINNIQMFIDFFFCEIIESNFLMHIIEIWISFSIIVRLRIYINLLNLSLLIHWIYFFQIFIYLNLSIVLWKIWYIVLYMYIV